ncbi:hypothetical protein SUBVAR_04848 [Subdoligranulum variabile DSM 15176]|uniref:Uncharacterized protein n=1 Tax=Subdoligranulum variabile DSM 15176 TaxID=411471 RepID=D1PKH2_9FIRM|nr:hypothetical protein SUBVAR_04848 [Subdoligranulum variabile DSM 15176]
MTQQPIPLFKSPGYGLGFLLPVRSFCKIQGQRIFWQLKFLWNLQNNIQII